MRRLLWALSAVTVTLGGTMVMRMEGRKTDLEPQPSERMYALGEAPSTASQQKVTHYVRYRQGDRVSYGILEGEAIRELSADYFSNPKPTGRSVRRDQVKILSPLDPMKTQKVVGVAVNFRRPQQQEIPHPRYFAKMPTAINDPEGEIELPPEATNLNYEGELVLVIGKKGRHIPVERALEHVFGVTVGNDYSENTWYGERKGVEEPTRLISKAMDSWAQLGPSIATGLDFADLEVITRLNGEVVNKGRTSDMVNSPAVLISYLSRYMTLMPGDVIYTGTYYPVNDGRRIMQAGDVVEVEVQNLGVLRSHIVPMPIAYAND